MNPIVTITTNHQETIICELFPEVAPVSVANFISLIEKGFYNNLIFHRVIPGFMIQGGCPLKNGTGGPGYSIKGEFKLNKFENNLKHTRGVLSMARAMNPDSAGSQFFIMHQDAPHLDGQYAAFGQVISGMEAVDRIAKVSRLPQDRPVEEQVMVSVTVERNGVELVEFEKLPR
jgi:peptidyl-prolyl cis-trans isomerase B (cyclophilin B)